MLFDVSLIINFHNEGELLRATIKSIFAAINFAKNYQKIKVEAIFVADCVDQKTLEIYEESDLAVADFSKYINVSNRSLALSRNDGIKAASGEYIMLFDADDLVNEAYIFQMYQQIKSSNGKKIVFPEYLLGFGNNNFLVKYFPSLNIPPFAFFGYNPYISRNCIKRELALQSLYIATPAHEGLAYEDWWLNCQKLVEDYEYLIAKGACIYYRQRENSLLKISSLGSPSIPFGDYFKFENYVKLANLYLGKAEIFPNNRYDTLNIKREFLANLTLLEQTKKAVSIEPKINNALSLDGLIINNIQVDNVAGLQYLRIAQQLLGLEFSNILVIENVENSVDIHRYIEKFKFNAGLIIILNNQWGGNYEYFNSNDRKVIDLNYAFSHEVNLAFEILMRILQNGATQVHLPLNVVKNFGNKIRQLNDSIILIKYDNNLPNKKTSKLSKISAKLFSNRELIKKIKYSGLFDVEFYSKKYGIKKEIALKHFVKHGIKSNLQPSILFDTNFYIAHHNDIYNEALNPFLHYLNYGLKEGRLACELDLSLDEMIRANLICKSGLFDAEFYRLNYLKNSQITPINHFIKFGCKYWFNPCVEFDASWYRSQYADVKGLNDSAQVTIHYLLHGKKEYRLCRAPVANLKLVRSELDQVVPFDEELAISCKDHDLKSINIVDGSGNYKLLRTLKSIITRVNFKVDTLLITDDYARIDELEIQDGNFIVITNKFVNEVDDMRYLSLNIFELTSSEKSELLGLLIQALCPKSVINLDENLSQTFYSRLTAYHNSQKLEFYDVNNKDLTIRPSEFDISIIINGHTEGEVINSTLKSVAAAKDICTKNSLKTEVIAVLDLGDEITRKILNHNSNLNLQVVETTFGDLGLARNYGVQMALGEYIAFVDGDDILGVNWLYEAFSIAKNENRDIIWHPECNLYFGKENFIFNQIDMETPTFDLYQLLDRNLWTASCFGKRQIFADIPYRKTDLAQRIGFEDWSFYRETIGYGILHKTVPNTCHFIRTKAQSLLQDTKSKSAIPHITNLFLSMFSKNHL